MTEEQYYSVNNRILTQSKVKDFLKDPEYFYKKHITGEISKSVSDAMIVGNAIDCWITEGKNAYRKKYYVPKKDNGNPANRDKNASDYIYQLTPAMEEMVREICEKVEEEPVYHDLLKNYERQKKLVVKDDNLGPYFDYLAGIPDFIKFKDDKCIIVDYKTAPSIDSKSYYYKCYDLGYFLQQAMYQMLVEKLYPEITEFESYHFVTAKDNDAIYQSQIFYMNQHLIEIEKRHLEMEIYYHLAQKESFGRNLAGWHRAIMLGGNNEDYNTVDI